MRTTTGKSKTHAAQDARDRRRAEGEGRNAAWAKLRPEQQLASLDSRLGVGIGAKRQRAKLGSALNRKAEVAKPSSFTDHNSLVQAEVSNAKGRLSKARA